MVSVAMAHKYIHILIVVVEWLRHAIEHSNCLLTGRRKFIAAAIHHNIFYLFVGVDGELGGALWLVYAGDVAIGIDVHLVDGFVQVLVGADVAEVDVLGVASHALVDDKSLDLVEDRRMGGVNGVGAVNTSRGDYPDRGLFLFLVVCCISAIHLRYTSLGSIHELPFWQNIVCHLY